MTRPLPVGDRISKAYLKDLKNTFFYKSFTHGSCRLFLPDTSLWDSQTSKQPYVSHYPVKAKKSVNFNA